MTEIRTSTVFFFYGFAEMKNIDRSSVEPVWKSMAQYFPSQSGNIYLYSHTFTQQFIMGNLSYINCCRRIQRLLYKNVQMKKFLQ